jgi:hypothetical protein
MAAAVAGMLATVSSVMAAARPYEGWLGAAVVFLSPLVVVCCAAAQYVPVPHFGLRFAVLGGGLFLLAATIVGLTGVEPPRLLHPPMPTLFVAPGGFCGVAAAVGASSLTAKMLENLVTVAVVGVVAGLDHAAVVRMARWRVRPGLTLAAHTLFCGALATSGVFVSDVAVGLILGVLLVTLALVVIMLRRWAKAIQAWLRW